VLPLSDEESHAVHTLRREGEGCANRAFTGKADTLQETPWDIARREAYEEIGLPTDNNQLHGFSVEHLCQLPVHLSLTEVGVLPCVAFLRPSTPPPFDSTTPASSRADATSAEERLIPHLDPKEVAAVFTAPFHNFLRQEWESDGPAPVQKNGKPEKWYRGAWVNWQDSQWRMHNFYVPRPLASPVQGRRRGRSSSSSSSSSSSKSNNTVPARLPDHKKYPRRPASGALDEIAAFRVFGLTARILVDAARVAYAEEPQFEHNRHHGDEEMIARLLKMGRLGEKTKQGGQLSSTTTTKGRGQTSKM